MEFYLIKMYGSGGLCTNKYITDQIPKPKDLYGFTFSRINIQIIRRFFHLTMGRID